MTNERIEMLNQILAENPNDAFARYGLAMEHANAGEIDTALAEFKKIIELNPDYTPAYQMAGQTLMRAARMDEARQMIEAGIASARRTRNQHAESELQGMLAEIS